jgi:hypothetical protein
LFTRARLRRSRHSLRFCGDISGFSPLSDCAVLHHKHNQAPGRPFERLDSIRLAKSGRAHLPLDIDAASNIG